MPNNITNKTTSAADTVRTDKKTNAAYWDFIDDTVYDCIINIAASSLSDTKFAFSETDFDECEDDNVALCDLYGDGIVGEIRDKIIEYLTEKGGDFPFVNENM